MNTSIPLTLAACAGVLLGCYSSRDYRGPGRIVDNGRLGCGRYVIDLGHVSPASRSSEYRVEGLPPVELTLGLGIDLPLEEVDLLLAEHAATASLRVLDSASRVVVDHSAPLSQWAWTCGGDRRDCSKSFGHHWRDTSFRPKRGAAYTFHLEVDSRFMLEHPMALRAQGGGLCLPM